MVFKPPRSNSSKHTVLLDSIILIEILLALLARKHSQGFCEQALVLLVAGVRLSVASSLGEVVGTSVSARRAAAVVLLLALRV